MLLLNGLFGGAIITFKMKEHIAIQEVGESTYHSFEELEEPLKDKYLKQTCTKCKKGFRDFDRVGYFYNGKKLVWWHELC